uniref:Glutaredoxin domain-containing protein n=1 Tax=Davidia involucrata TaxID=16924 RepID=A0A5B7B6W0_DAVIN
MGCASSKLFRKDLKREIVFGNGDNPNHVVSLTSSTYGVLKLDKEQQQQQQQQQPIREIAMESKKSPPREEPEIINAWELMGDLEDEAPISVQTRKSPKSRVFLRGFADIDARSPLKFLNQMSSPKKLKRFGGKENKGTPKRVLNSWNGTPNSRISMKGSPIDSVILSRRRSLGPLFDPELVASYEKELSEEEEQIKNIVSATPTTRKSRNSRDSESILELFEKKCPPGGENAVVIYTTTLRGIRKTFEDCNTARSITESHHIQMFERDVSMDSGFKEELRGLMGKVKVPLVFVKGRLIGGADEMVRLEEEGKLGILFDGIPRAVAGCDGCAGVRFMMCMDCNGSCKVLEGDGKKTVRCGECNENGLIHCPICC